MKWLEEITSKASWIKFKNDLLNLMSKNWSSKDLINLQCKNRLKMYDLAFFLQSQSQALVQSALFNSWIHSLEVAFSEHYLQSNRLDVIYQKL